jgi:hypothetical protein
MLGLRMSLHLNRDRLVKSGNHDFGLSWRQAFVALPTRGLMVSLLMMAVPILLNACGGATDTTKPPVPIGSTIQLPLEVQGAEGTEISVVLKLSANQAQAAQNIWLQTHNLRYANKASLKINNSNWIDLNNTSAQMQGTSKTYGGIGGAFATLKMLVAIPANGLKTGDNTLMFRFNTSDGLSMGYRIIGLNLQNSSGTMLLPQSAFSQADPANFSNPSTNPADIEAGKVLWNTAALKKNYLPNATSINARCADCHTVTGADLKYFGYSNYSILERAKFHGLSQNQGNQIASYIRSLPVKAIGRPWNPPYQPGLGISSKPNDEWAAGAGIENVLEEDTDTIKAIFPNGISRETIMIGDSNKFKRFSSHDIPLAFQLPDWNHWLPEVHPMDSMKNWFETSSSLAHYRKIRQQLTGKSTEEIRQWFRNSNNGEAGGKLASTGYFAMNNLYAEGVAEVAKELYPSDLDQNSRITNLVQAKNIYSLALWRMVKHFELHEEFKLTEMGREPQDIAWAGYDSKEALPRMWIGANRVVFDVSPFLSGLESGVTGSASGNNSFNYDYLSNAWYQLQLMLNAGQRTGFNHQVLDFGYAHGFLDHFNDSTNNQQLGRNFVWSLKGMDEGDNDRGPNIHDGWSFNRASLRPVSDYLNNSSNSTFTKEALALLTQVWLEKNASWLPEQIFNDPDGSPKTGNEDGVQFDRPDYVLGTGNPEYQERGHADHLNAMMPTLITNKTYPPALQNGYATWAQAMWSSNGWLKYTLPRVGNTPAAPIVTAATGTNVNVIWATSNVKSYNVKRSDTPNGLFLTIAYFRTSNGYTDSPPLSGRTYYYRISTNTEAGESPDSSNTAITP